MERDLDGREDSEAETVRDMLDNQAERVAAKVEAGDAWEQEITEEETRGVLEALYRATFMDYARRAYDAVEGATKADPPSSVIEAWLREVLRILGDVAATRIKGITDTTKQYIWFILREAQSDGVGPDEAARRIRRRMPEINRSRAKRIARTELNSTANAGTHSGVVEAGRELGVEMEKVWYASPDGPESAGGRVRDSHWAIHEKGVDINEPFNVGGYPMQHPGEFGAPASEVINCRCTTLYEVKE